MTDPMTFQLVPDDSAKGKAKHLEDALLDALQSGAFRLYAITESGAREEWHVSEATHSRGHSEFDPKDAKKDKHGPHKAKHDDGTVTFTIAPVV